MSKGMPPVDTSTQFVFACASVSESDLLSVCCEPVVEFCFVHSFAHRSVRRPTLAIKPNRGPDSVSMLIPGVNFINPFEFA